VVSTLKLAVFLVAALVALADSGNAQNPPWCAILDNDEQQAPQVMPTQPSSENAQGLLQLQQQDPGPPPGLDGSAAQGPPNN
jgi:hypothetical protein